MPRFQLSRAAQSDLDAIADYTLQRWGKEQARTYIDALHGRLTELAHQTLPGRKRNEVAEGLLSFPFESHVIFYTLADFGVTVVRLLHKRQDPFRHID